MAWQAHSRTQNPPFIGAKFQNDEQRADMDSVADDVENGGLLDYVTGWYFKAAEYIQGTRVVVGLARQRSKPGKRCWLKSHCISCAGSVTSLNPTLRAKNLFASEFCAVFIKSTPGITLGANKIKKHLFATVVPVVQIFLLTNHVGKTGDAANSDAKRFFARSVRVKPKSNISAPVKKSASSRRVRNAARLKQNP